MLVKDIFEACRRRRGYFEECVRRVDYEDKGVLFSEMLLFCAVSEALGAGRIIESGRARGVSTAILAEYFPASSGVEIFSMEYFRFTGDALFAEKRLSGYSNLHLLYGDSLLELPGLAAGLGPSAVLIDGPKGNKGVCLAAAMLKATPDVRAVFVHDCDADAYERKKLDMMFPRTFSSDAPDFVDEFKSLDDSCWEKSRTISDQYAPYLRDGASSASYGPTFTAVFNAPGLEFSEPADLCRYTSPLRKLSGLKSLIPTRCYFRERFGRR